MKCGFVEADVDACDEARENEAQDAGVVEQETACAYDGAVVVHGVVACAQAEGADRSHRRER